MVLHTSITLVLHTSISSWLESIRNVVEFIGCGSWDCSSEVAATKSMFLVEVGRGKLGRGKWGKYTHTTSHYNHCNHGCVVYRPLPWSADADCPHFGTAHTHFGTAQNHFGLSYCVHICTSGVCGWWYAQVADIKANDIFETFVQHAGRN